MPELGACASSGRAWRLWAAWYSSGERPRHWTPSHRLGCSSEPPPKSPILSAFRPLQVSGRPDTHAEGLGAYLLYLRHFLSRKPPPTMEERFESPYYDYLQAPLQPLQDNLESQTCARGLQPYYSLLTTHYSLLTAHYSPLTTHYSLLTRYETFEKDPIKYREYQRAIMLALQDRQSTGRFAKMSVDACAPTSETATGAADGAGAAGVEPTVIMVVGAGRGPLVAAALAASQEAGVPVKVYAVEKNENAVVTLQNRCLNEPQWEAHVTVVPGDMREVSHGNVLADILVSELLGSWGDNELSPECLDGAHALPLILALTLTPILALALTPDPNRHPTPKQVRSAT